MPVIESKKLLIISDQSLSKSDELCLSALIDGLADRSIDLYRPNSAKTYPNVNYISELSPKRYVLSFNRSNGSIKNVQWQQTDTEISLHISMDDGAFTPENMRFQTHGSDFEQVILFNVSDTTLVDKLFAGADLKTTKFISIGVPVVSTSFKATPLGSAPTIIEQLFGELKPSKNAYTKLAAAILISTDRLQSEFRPELLNILAQIVPQSDGMASINKLVEESIKLSDAPTIN